MQATLFTREELKREDAIMDVVRAYNEEIDWWFENEATSMKFSLKDPSKAFITARQKRDFAEWYPVRLSHVLRMPFLTAPVLPPLRTHVIANFYWLVGLQKGKPVYFRYLMRVGAPLNNPFISPYGLRRMTYPGAIVLLCEKKIIT